MEEDNMELTLKRKFKSTKSTIGELSIDGKFECHILEDVDLGLKSSDSLAQLNKLKIKSKTAIPIGRYEVIVTYSNRFKKDLPLLVDVPAYEGIRIHPGNAAVDTDGCLLPGTYVSSTPDFVASSRVAFDKLFTKLKNALAKDKVYINII